MSNIDKRIKVNTIIENQLPEFVVTDFPKAAEFLKQYYISQEFQGGASDLINNFDQYLKPDNLVPEVVVGITTTSADISLTDTTITVPSTKGFPSEYGLLKIDDEIISYTGITSTTFTGCIRGFSGISALETAGTPEFLTFSDTNASSHAVNSSVINLSFLFVTQFYKKFRKHFLPGLEGKSFSYGLNVENILSRARDFYSSKGTDTSLQILFQVLYGEQVDVIKPFNQTLLPSLG